MKTQSTTTSSTNSVDTSYDEKRKTFVFYISWWEALSKFPMEMHFAVFNAVMTYVSTGEVPEIEDDAVRLAFELIRIDIDMAQAKYDAKIQTRKRAAQKRWAKAKEESAEESQPQTSKESTTSTTTPEEEVLEERMSDDEGEMSIEEGEMPEEEELAEESSEDKAESLSSELFATYGRQPFEPMTSRYIDAGNALDTSEREIHGSRGNPGTNSDAIKIDYGDYGTRFAV